MDTRRVIDDTVWDAERLKDIQPTTEATYDGLYAMHIHPWAKLVL